MSKRSSLIILALLVTFFLDSYLSYYLSALTAYNLVISSHLLLIILLYAGVSLRGFWLYPFMVVFGIFYDAYYFSALGLSVWLFPLCLYLFRLFRPHMLGGRLERFLFLICLLFTFSVALYGLARAYGMTTYPFNYFVTYDLAPSLLLAALYLLLFQRSLDALFL